MSIVEVTVGYLGLDPQTNHPMVFLQEKDGHRVLPIWIGPVEANAIASELRGQKHPRPLTHDLLKQVIIGLGASITEVLITRVEKNTYFAELKLRRHDHVVQVDARPSDSIALALRLNAPIFADEDLLVESDQLSRPAPDQPLDPTSLKKYLQDLDPEDFGKFTP